MLKTVELHDRGAGKIDLHTNGLPAGDYHYTLVIEGRAFATRTMVLTH